MDACEFLKEFGVLVFEGGVDATAEAGCEGLVVDEEFVFGWMVEGVVFGMEGDAGDDEVDVGMVLDLAAPGVEDAGEAKAGSLVLGGADVCSTSQLIRRRVASHFFILGFSPRRGWPIRSQENDQKNHNRN